MTLKKNEIEDLEKSPFDLRAWAGGRGSFLGGLACLLGLHRPRPVLFWTETGVEMGVLSVEDVCSRCGLEMPS